MTKRSALRTGLNTAGRFALPGALFLGASLFCAAEEALSAAEKPAATIAESGQSLEAPAQKTLIYKSVDAEGRVSFGDHPGANAVELETLERPRYQQNASPEELQTRIDQMAAATRRLQEDRKLRAKLRQQEAEANKPYSQPPIVVVEQPVYRPRRVIKPYPYLYKPHRSGSSLGLHLGGGNSSFHYGLSYGSPPRHSEGRLREERRIETPYRREQGHIRSSALIKRPQK
ncbi:MAG: DUF4124 domain-containing protein [Gammaproteobacteria bacterium]|nr:DUF4124 domain-containing protein [Gammaproteobacteria bacterium]MBQ0838794.1 DUF4124 domain-containing protein [Gammaproteobacteria bacterium]